MNSSELSFDGELEEILALLSYPIQGVLSILRLRNHNNQDTIFEDDKRDNISVQRRQAETSLTRKLALYASTIYRTERKSLLAEFPLLSTVLGKRGTRKRHNIEISQCSATNHKLVGGSFICDDYIIENLNANGNNCGKVSVGSQVAFQLHDTGVSDVGIVDLLNAVEGQGDLACNDIGCQNNISRKISGNMGSKHIFKPYSKSSVWSTQQQFYKESGAGVWERGEVPSLISSNPFVAEMYVDMIMQMADKHWYHLREISIPQSHLLPKLIEKRETYCNDDNTSVRKLRLAVIEIGAGHGLLSFLMARKFQQIMSGTKSSTNDFDRVRKVKASSSSVDDNVTAQKTRIYNDLRFSERFDVTIIGTDFHSSVFEELLQCPWISQLCGAGYLDFATCGLFEADNSCLSSLGTKGLKLLHCGRCSDDQIWDILVIIGNYAFDSFPSDLVACTATGQIYEIGVQKQAINLANNESCGNKNLVEKSSRKKREPYIARAVRTGGDSGISDNIMKMVRLPFSPSDSTRCSSVHSIPTVGMKIMQQLKVAFPLSNQASSDTLPRSGSNPADIAGAVIMIVGDCIVAEDDDQWQSKEFEKLSIDDGDDVNSIENTNNEPVLIPWFDPPLISPQPSVCAVPVSPRSLDYAFREIFGTNTQTDTNYVDMIYRKDEISSNCNANDNEKKEFLISSYLRSCTPISASSFSVLTYSSHKHLHAKHACDLQNSNKADHDQENMGPIIYPRLGPNDFCTFRELLLADCPQQGTRENQLLEEILPSESESLKPIEQDCGEFFYGLSKYKQRNPRKIAETVSLNFLWNFIIPFACVDSLLFISLRWIILDKIMELALGSFITTDDHDQERFSHLDIINEVQRWSDTALECVRCHSCLTLNDILSLRAQIAHWLVAVGSTLWKLYVGKSGKDSIMPSKSTLTAIVYVLRSCLSLFSESEMQQGLGSSPEAMLQTVRTSLMKSLWTPLFCHSVCIINLRGNENIVSSKVSQSEGNTSKHSEKQNQNKLTRLLQIPKNSHFLSKEEAIHCIFAAQILLKISLHNDTKDDNLNPGILTKDESLHLIYISNSILDALENHNERNLTAAKVKDSRRKSKIENRIEKKFRKAKRMFNEFNQVYLSVCCENIDALLAT